VFRSSTASRSKKRLKNPRKATEKTLRIIFGAIRDGLTQRDAATLAGISEDTLSLWKRDSEFSEQIRQKEIECKRRHIRNIQNAGERSWQASAWWLERKYRTEFGKEDKLLAEIRSDNLDEIAKGIKAILGGDSKARAV